MPQVGAKAIEILWRDLPSNRSVLHRLRHDFFQFGALVGARNKITILRSVNFLEIRIIVCYMIQLALFKNTEYVFVYLQHLPTDKIAMASNMFLDFIQIFQKMMKSSSNFLRFTNERSPSG